MGKMVFEQHVFMLRGLLHSRRLGNDADAVGIFCNHLLQAPNLSFNDLSRRMSLWLSCIEPNIPPRYKSTCIKYCQLRY